MPVVFRDGNVRFLFYSDEGKPREPVHIHVRDGRREAKFWIEPDIRLDRSFGFKAHELRRFRRLIERNADDIRRRWDEHFGD